MGTRRSKNRGARAVSALLLAAALLAVCALPGCSWFKKDTAVTRKNAKKAAGPVIVCPLCGAGVKDEALMKRRPVAIKVENEPRARPQSGLDRACVVYEELTEGGITRFMAIYLCGDVDIVGPVRSARPADIEIVYPYQALFAHCGGGRPTLRMIKESGIADVDEFAWSGAYWRIRERRAPHNLYTSTGRLRQVGDREYPFQGEIAAPFEFLSALDIKRMKRERRKEQKRAADAARSAPGEEYLPLINVVSRINIPYQESCAVEYVYDEVTGRFSRLVANSPHTDLTTGQQLAADNVIVQYVTEAVSGIKDVYGAQSPELGVVGAGRAQVFVLGQLIDANWHKNSREEHTRFVDNSGEPIPLKPGTTWIQLVPATRQVSVSQR